MPDSFLVERAQPSRQPARAELLAGQFGTVLAQRCVIADALTKVALSMSARRVAILEKFQATALVFEPANGWITLGQRPAPSLVSPMSA